MVNEMMLPLHSFVNTIKAGRMKNCIPLTVRGLLVALIVVFTQLPVRGQTCGNLNFQKQADVTYPCSNEVLSMLRDPNRPYLYVANKEGGLKVYNVTTMSAPVLAASIATTSFGGLHVMNLDLQGDYLYLALGNSFTNPQSAGLAVVSVSNVNQCVVTYTYILPGSSSGGGVVKAEGNYVYFGAMQSGLVIFDASNNSALTKVGQFLPSLSFPPVTNPNADTYNARGMAVKSGVVYLCYDAGGVRVINCTNPASPKESGRWCNSVMYLPTNKAKAYNNCVLNDSLLYVAVDYCGMEILNVKDTAHISLKGWWNPYNCPTNNWFSSPGHANEIHLDKNCGRVFLSTGKSQLHVIDVSHPSHPDSCGFYGGVTSNGGSWGLSVFQNELYLSYVCAVIPFYSSFTKWSAITFNGCINALRDDYWQEMTIYPQPADHLLQVLFPSEPMNAHLQLLKLDGRLVYEQAVKGVNATLNVESISPGIYLLQLVSGSQVRVRKIIIE